MACSPHWKKRRSGADWAFKEHTANGHGEGGTTMIQLVAAAAVGAVGLYAYNSFKKHMQAIKAEEAKKAAENQQPKSVGDLEHDPTTGRYKLKK